MLDYFHVFINLIQKNYINKDKKKKATYFVFDNKTPEQTTVKKQVESKTFAHKKEANNFDSEKKEDKTRQVLAAQKKLQITFPKTVAYPYLQK